MKRIIVPLKKRSYSVVINPFNKEFPKALKKLGVATNAPLLLVSSPVLQKKGHLSRITRILHSAGFRPKVVLIRDGERNKNLSTLSVLYKKALALGLDRTSTIIAVGGGVITDLAGFFAATYLRGIRYVSVPTTLLAMVDASIGGKTGVDLPEGKNLVGSFWQPSLVWVDPSVLSTLPEREWKTGMAEVVKYGIIRDRKFFEWIEAKVKHRPDIRLWKGPDLEKILSTSIKHKAEVVAADEMETPLKGGREILNFGHTIGHALEAATGYKLLTHGEAISIGMVIVGQMALELGLWSRDAQLRLMSLFQALGLPVHLPRLSKTQVSTFWSALHKDKKNVDRKLRFILPKKIGSVEVRSGIALSLIKSVLH